MIFNEKIGLLTLLVLDSYLCFESFCQNSGVNNKNNPLLAISAQQYCKLCVMFLPILAVAWKNVCLCILIFCECLKSFYLFLCDLVVWPMEINVQFFFLYNIFSWNSDAYRHIVFNVRLHVIPVRETLYLEHLAIWK